MITRVCKIFTDKKANYAVKVEGIDMIPFPIVSGQPATFKISASSGKPLFYGCVWFCTYYLESFM